jgi:FO synthase
VGLATLPGTAAEILDDEVRAVLCSDKVNTQEWLDAHRTAHRVGLRSNVTIMFGSIEHPRSWARHLVRTRPAGGDGRLHRVRPAAVRAHGLADLPAAQGASRTHLARGGADARGRPHRLPRLHPNIQASWVKLGVVGVRQLLQAGVNDLGGTLMDENISRAAGASHGQGMDEEAFRALVAPLGRPLTQRTTLYAPVPQPA